MDDLSKVRLITALAGGGVHPLETLAAMDGEPLITLHDRQGPVRVKVRSVRCIWKNHPACGWGETGLEFFEPVRPEKKQLFVAEEQWKVERNLLEHGWNPRAVEAELKRRERQRTKA
jgi:hypothetical protein